MDAAVLAGLGDSDRLVQTGKEGVGERKRERRRNGCSHAEM